MSVPASGRTAGASTPAEDEAPAIGAASPGGPRAPMLRLFFALEPPPAVLVALHALARATGVRLGGRISRADTLHLTLAFLGDVPAARLPALCALAEEVPPAVCTLVLDELALWHHNRIAWAGARRTPSALAALADRLRQRLTAAGFPVDTGHAFTPHVTLVRRVPASGLPLAELGLPAMAPLAWPLRGYSLIASTTLPAGVQHQRLARFGADDPEVNDAVTK